MVRRFSIPTRIRARPRQLPSRHFRFSILSGVSIVFSYAEGPSRSDFQSAGSAEERGAGGESSERVVSGSTKIEMPCEGRGSGALIRRVLRWERSWREGLPTTTGRPASHCAELRCDTSASDYDGTNSKSDAPGKDERIEQ